VVLVPQAEHLCVSPSGRRPKNTAPCCRITTSRFCFISSKRISTTPISGRERDGRAPSVVRRTLSRSPGLTGFSQSIESIPGDPCALERRNTSSQLMRIISAALCQPEAISPAAIDSRAAASSRWNGCGSNSRANSTISSAVTTRSPNSTTSPTGKSSK
jgi:hypothetical protein